jgi:threonylcarbamoyladenosine tRNA methylthiotransferase MtaB
MAQRNKLCRYLHIPLQSGSDTILQAMKRQYTVQDFVNFLMFAHQTSQETCLGTDIIVGFPGETEALFEETYELLLNLPFTYFHVFSYSDRDHAKSSKYADKIPRETIALRSRKLRELSARKRRVYFQKFLGKTETVLFEMKKNGYWSGLSDTYIRVKVKSDLNIENQLLPVRLERIENQTMTGVLV